MEAARPNELLRQEREHRQLSQADIALQLGLPDWRIVSRWERGVSFPSYQYRRQLCSYFGKSAQELGLVSASASYWHVPYSRNALFTGREDVLAQIYNMWKQGQRGHSLALCGMAGIGKTQIVLEYAHRHRDDFHAVFWVRAGLQETLDEDFRRIAALLHMPERDEEDQQRVIQAVNQWLSPLSRWLLIFDGVEDLRIVGRYLSLSYQGQVLLTTRTQITGSLAEALDIPTMGQKEGVSLLLKRAKKSEGLAAAELEGAEKLVEVMEGLPLALDQVGAYIEQTGCSFSEYFDLYQRYAPTMLQKRGDLDGGYATSVTDILQLIFERVQQANPHAMEFLLLLAFLDLDTITEEALTKDPSASGPILETILTNRLLWNAALSELLKYSLIRRASGQIAVHPLVRAILKEYVKTEERDQWIVRAQQIMKDTLIPG